MSAQPFDRRRLLAAACALLLLPATAPAQGPAETPTVELTVDFGDGAQKRYPAAPWRDGLTVADLVQWASRHPHGVTYAARGSGATAFLHQIDDVSNRGADGRNWLFRVNGSLGKESFAVTRLSAGDRVLWEFAEYR